MFHITLIVEQDKYRLTISIKQIVVKIQLLSLAVIKNVFPTLIFMRPIDLLSLNMTKIKFGFTGFLQQGQVSCLQRINTNQFLSTSNTSCLFIFHVN